MAAESNRTKALTLLEALCKDQEKVTSDDFWKVIDEAQIPMAPKEMGSLWLLASRNGWVVGTNQTIFSRRPAANGKAIPIYVSRLFLGEDVDQSTTAS